MNERKIYKPRPVSGFPEWLPEVRLVEQQWLDHIRRVFEGYGYCSIETPAVEELDVITAKGGDADKEIYVLERLHKEPGDKEARLALHFDQTVPLARYVAQNFNGLVFPFKRYQMQKVWRGERPQAGRFREFYQCDIDVINVDNLPLSFDAEMPAIIYEILTALPGMENEKIQLQVSNRKILLGLLDFLNVQDPVRVTRMIDKLDQAGEDAFRTSIKHGNLMGFQRERLTDSDISKILNLVSAKNLSLVEPQNKQMEEGLNELQFVMDQLKHLPSIVPNLSIVRGLDYYTGTVYETVFLDNPEYGSICSGGRYDDLASSYINKKLPGVGISIGFSRLFARLLEQGKLPVGPLSPADILMILPSDEGRAQAAKAARTLRERGYKVELYHAARKIPDQLKYASKKNIPYVWFPDLGEVKNMATGTQTKADPGTWKK